MWMNNNCENMSWCQDPSKTTEARNQTMLLLVVNQLMPINSVQKTSWAAPKSCVTLDCNADCSGKWCRNNSVSFCSDSTGWSRDEWQQQVWPGSLAECLMATMAGSWQGGIKLVEGREEEEPSRQFGSRPLWTTQEHLQQQVDNGLVVKTKDSVERRTLTRVFNELLSTVDWNWSPSTTDCGAVSTTTTVAWLVLSHCSGMLTMIGNCEEAPIDRWRTCCGANAMTVVIVA